MIATTVFSLCHFIEAFRWLMMSFVCVFALFQSHFCRMSSTLEADNEGLRQKLQDLRRMNSNLVVENHRLVEALEDLGCKFESSSVKVHNLEDSIESYRSKSRELSDLLTAVESKSKSNEKDSQIFKLKYEECAHQLSESAKLLMDQADVIQSMKRRLEDVQNLQRKTDGDFLI